MPSAAGSRTASRWQGWAVVTLTCWVLVAPSLGLAQQLKDTLHVSLW